MARRVLRLVRTKDGGLAARRDFCFRGLEELFGTLLAERVEVACVERACPRTFEAGPTRRSVPARKPAVVPVRPRSFEHVRVEPPRAGGRPENPAHVPELRHRRVVSFRRVAHARRLPFLLAEQLAAGQAPPADLPPASDRVASLTDDMRRRGDDQWRTRVAAAAAPRRRVGSGRSRSLRVLPRWADFTEARGRAFLDAVKVRGGHAVLENGKVLLRAPVAHHARKVLVHEPAPQSPWTIRIVAAASPRPAHGRSAAASPRPVQGPSRSSPRRRRDPSKDHPGHRRGVAASRPRTIQVIAAASPRPARADAGAGTTAYTCRGFGVARCRGRSRDRGRRGSGRVPE